MIHWATRRPAVILATSVAILLAGGGAGALGSGRHLRYAGDTPLANLHVTLLDMLNVRVDHIGDSNGVFTELSIGA